MATPTSIPRLEYIQIKNYRALKDITFKGITPLTVLLGPNGSGKSTVFDVFAFLSECFGVGLRKAWHKRGRFKELRTRDSKGPIVFELKYREKPGAPIITYHLEINEDAKGPYVELEWLRWSRRGSGRPFDFLRFSKGKGFAISGADPDKDATRSEEELASREFIAVSTLGQLNKHPRVTALRKFITGWYLSYLTADSTRGVPESGPQERLSTTGDNLPNVIQYLYEQHPDQLKRIEEALVHRIPRLEKVKVTPMPDGRLLLQVKDAPFTDPVMAKYASDGTLKMLAYLTLLYDPEPPELIGIEEPENQLHPKLLYELAEECRKSAQRSQLIITSHSPEFVNALRSEEVWVISRDDKGYTRAQRAADMKGIPKHVQTGGMLGDLWMEGFFESGYLPTKRS
ncbi:MAG: AAA family ATPase [Flavobacteriales bacterium]|nr:AAA family ATPase [Flavobacteriales bacterium]